MVIQMTEFYIVRHGQTNSNILQKCVGHKDVPLNDAGREQISRLAEKLHNVKFDAAYSSPLQRAVDTAAAATENQKNLNIAMSYGLIERDYGEWDDLSFAEIDALDHAEYMKWQENWISYTIPGGESAEDVQKRVDEALDKMLSKHKGERILIATHLGTARHILSHLLGLTTEQSWLFTLDNAGIAVVSVDENGNGLLKGLNI